MKTIYPLLLLVLCISSCAVSKNYNPAHKYGPDELQKDYQLFRTMLEEAHPSLYWYTPKDSIDYYFDQGAAKLQDSLTEGRFRYVLSYVLSKIRCGHTSVRASRGASRYAERSRSVQFPLSIKAWDDTVVITSNLSKKDSTVARGLILKSIDNHPVEVILDSFFQHLTADGYNLTHKYQTVSSPGVFRNMYAALYGLKASTPVQFIDTSGNLVNSIVGLYVPVIDTTKKIRTQPDVKVPTKKERKKMARAMMCNFHVDESLNTGFMEVNSFSKNYGLRKFLRQSFKQMRKEGVTNLVVDMRGNGGGNVSLSNLMTKYIANKPFKIADSLYAITNRSHYHQYYSNYLLNRLFFIFMVNKKKDGHYHFGYYENKYFKPKNKNNFSGTTYILTGGNTFSAASLFAKALKDQQDVVIVGEETGGGAYGNTAWLIPDVTLPHTHVRFRMPLFRLVIDTNEVKGRGIMPEVEVKPTVEAIRRNEDFKMDTVKELIREKNGRIVQHH